MGGGTRTSYWRSPVQVEQVGSLIAVLVTLGNVVYNLRKASGETRVADDVRSDAFVARVVDVLENRVRALHEDIERAEARLEKVEQQRDDALCLSSLLQRRLVACELALLQAGIPIPEPGAYSEIDRRRRAKLAFVRRAMFPSLPSRLRSTSWSADSAILRTSRTGRCLSPMRRTRARLWT